MRTYLTAAALVLALASPATVMAFGAPCAQARVASEACCASGMSSADDDGNAHLLRTCCCEIGDASASAAQDTSAVLEAPRKAPASDTLGVVTFVVPVAPAATAPVHPEARGPPAQNSLLSQHISLLI